MAGKVSEKLSDYSFGPGRSPAMGAFNAGFTTVTVTAGAYLSESVHPWWGLAVGGIAAAGSVLTLVWDNHLKFTEGPVMCYRAACWLGAGIWSTVQLSLHPWSWSSVGVLGGMTAAAAAVGGGLRRGEVKRHAEAEEKIRATEEREAQEKADAAAAAEAAKLSDEDRIARYWQPRFRKICRLPELVIEGVEIWETGDGYMLGGLVPDDGSTVSENVKPYEKALATAADLKGGCNVEIFGDIEGESRRVFHAKINTFNAMAEDQPYPEDYSNRSIVDPIPVGVGVDRSIGTISLLDDGAAIIGQKGSGKSTLLNVIIAGVARCTDAVVCVIDTKGRGELARRWRESVEDGRAERSAILLAAVTNDQAELLTLGLINVAEGRPAHYAALMRRQNSMKFMPSPTEPQIILIIDEFKSLPDSVKENVEILSDKGRSAGIEVVVCALEAKGNALPASIRAQMRERIGLRFNDEEAMQYLFSRQWKSGRFDPASMTHPGMMMVATGARPPVQHKGYGLDPARIDEIAIAVGVQRPPLDDASIAMFDTVTRRVRDAKDNWVMETVTDVYTTWWDKTLPLMFGRDNGQGKEMANAGSVPPPAAKIPAGNPLDALAASNTSLARALDNLRAEAEEAEAEREPDHDYGDLTADELSALFDLQLPARQRCWAHIRQAGPEGIGASALEKLLQGEGYPTVRQTIQDWLVEDFGNDRLTKPDGTKGRYAWNPDQPQ